MGFELHPETPTAGIPKAERFPKRDPAVFENIQRMGESYGLSFRENALLSNSRLALQAGEFARDNGRYEAFQQLVYKAYFEEGMDIGSLDVVLRLADKGGLNSAQLRLALQKGRYLNKLNATKEQARRLSVVSVPTFIINGQDRIVGAQPLSRFRNYLNALQTEQG